MLTDEQILEVVPESASTGGPQDVALGEGAPPASLLGSTEQSATLPESAVDTAAQPSATGNTAAAPAPFSSPEDLHAVAELYPGGLTQAKTAAERARLLDDIDRAYFGAQGSTAEQVRASRAELAQMMLREDPAAFREMVFAGLRALETASVAQPLLAVPSASAAPTQHVPIVNAAAPLATTAVNARDAQASVPAPPQHLTAYSEFEKAANADLEKSVGSSIQRALHQALPHSERSENTALAARLSTAIRQDVEKALQGDRQLGEQVAQILAGRRFDHETRAQVVRLINDRAQQLVPGAAKRALHDWTQATLAAHRNTTSHADAASSRRELATAAAPAPNSVSAQAPRANARTAANGRVNYRKLSDEQILDL